MQVDLGVCTIQAIMFEMVHESPECSDSRPFFAREVVKVRRFGLEKPGPAHNIAPADLSSA